MYSVILLAAMSTTPEVPDFKRRGNDCGQSDCGGCGSTGGHRGKKHRGHGGCGSTCGHSSGGCGQACGGCGQAYGGCDSGCGGCGSGFGGYGTAMPAHHGAPTPAPAETVPAPKPMGALSPTSATLVVTGAADAKVTIGGLESASVADMRVMVSPSLEAGQTYHYDLTAEANGVKLTQSVTVKAGVLTEVTLDFAGRTVAMK